MIACKQCQTVNGLDHKFCKTCGAPLADDAIRVAMEKHEQMVQEGYSLFNAGRTDEAFLIAQAAVEEYTESANALTLLGMCFERTGQLAEALECFEKVVMLNPDSALDRMKVTQLRNTLTNHLHTGHKANVTLALAIGTTFLVIFVVAGIVIASFWNRQPLAQGTPLSAGAPTQSVVDRPFDPQPLPPVQPKAQTSALGVALTSPVTQVASQAPSQHSAPASSVDSQDQQPLFIEPTTRKAVLDTSTGSDTSTSNNAGDPPPSSANGTAQTDPNPQPDGGTQPQQSAPKDDPGVIEISVVHQTSGDNGAGSSSGGLASTLKSARDEYYRGNYASAAKVFERALSIGGDEASINQRLGICYERLGRSSDAVTAYSKAAQAYEVALNAGQGDSRRLKSALDSCKQAIKLLKG